MSFTRRSFLIGAGSGLSLLVLSACVDEAPVPTPRPSPTRTRDIARPSAFARSSWSADPYARGSHSFMEVGSTPEHRDALRQPILDRVFFAGEATSSEAAGTVAGALVSGARAADELALVADSGDKVAVIGAGIAGAEAARILASAGYEVVVVEARNRIGGRIQTVESKQWPMPVELGAWRLGKSDDEVTTRLDELGIDTGSLSGTDFISPTATATAYPAGATAIDSALAWAGDQPQDMSLADALDQSGAGKTAVGSALRGFDGAALLEQYLEALATRYGADASELSSWYGIDDKDVPEQIVSGGYGGLVKDALDGIHTSLSTVVAEVAYSEDNVSLRLGTGESLRVDRVVVTVPLGVLKKDSLKFKPLLPFAHRTAIASLGVGTVDTVWLAFDEPFWSTDAAVWNLVGTDDDITFWINLQPLTGESVLVGLVAGESALRVARLNDDQLTESAMLALRPFMDA